MKSSSQTQYFCLIYHSLSTRNTQYANEIEHRYSSAGRFIAEECSAFHMQAPLHFFKPLSCCFTIKEVLEVSSWWTIVKLEACYVLF